MFNWESFADSVRYHCLHSKTPFDQTIENIVLSSTSVFFSFVKDGKDDVSTPCWVQLDVLAALQQAKGNLDLFFKTPFIFAEARCDITNTRECVTSGFSNTEKMVEKTKRRRVFLKPTLKCLDAYKTLFRVFDIITQTYKYRDNEEIKSAKSEFDNAVYGFQLSIETIVLLF